MKPFPLFLLCMGALCACTTEDPEGPSSVPLPTTDFEYGFINRSGRRVEIARQEYSESGGENNLPNIITLDDGEAFYCLRPETTDNRLWDPFGGERFWVLFDDARMRMSLFYGDMDFGSRDAYVGTEYEGRTYALYEITDAHYRQAVKYNEFNPIWPEHTRWEYCISNRSGRPLNLGVYIDLMMENYFTIEVADGEDYRWTSEDELADAIFGYGGYMLLDDELLDDQIKMLLTDISPSPMRISDYELERVGEDELHWKATFVWSEEDLQNTMEYNDFLPDSFTYLDYHIVNASGQHLTLELIDVLTEFPPLVELADGECYDWNWRPEFKWDTGFFPFTLRVGSRIVWNHRIAMEVQEFPEERNFMYMEAWRYTPTGINLDFGFSYWNATYTFTEEDYQYALEHGTVISDEQTPEEVSAR